MPDEQPREITVNFSNVFDAFLATSKLEFHVRVLIPLATVKQQGFVERLSDAVRPLSEFGEVQIGTNLRFIRETAQPARSAEEPHSGDLPTSPTTEGDR
jgi:hypothetical protein